MTFQEELYTLLEANLFVLVRRKCDGENCVFSPHKDEGGDFRVSGWWNNRGEAMKHIGHFCGYSKDRIIELSEEKNWVIIGKWYLTPKPLKVGDKVEILKTIEETDDWEECKKDFPDMTGVIDRVYNFRIGLHYLINGYDIGAEYVAPLVENKEEVLELTLDQIAEKFGKDVKQIKIKK